ncbi:Fc.00g030580.m01.CDS01 [Cosmosporella sp. VM-42]
MNYKTTCSKPRQYFMPPQLPRRDSVTDSMDSEDPLAAQPSTRGGTPNYLRPNASPMKASPTKTRFVVMLNASPHRSAHTAVPQEKNEGTTVISDLSLQYGQRSKVSSQSPKLRLGGQPTPRPRGRPKGVGNAPRNSAATAAGSRQARQVKPRPPPNGFPKRRGRPPKEPSPPPREIYQKSEAPFIAFLCEWRGCKAELHNLDTLRRHVYFVHGEEGDRPHCLWGKCGNGEEGAVFDKEDAFDKHIEEAHLVPFAWHVGDGPNNSFERKPKTEVEEIPDWLKDEHGNQVTPSIQKQQMEDFATWRGNRRKLRELLRRRDENLPDEESEAVDEEMY